MIAVIDYGLGNTGSIKNMLKKVGYPDVVITHNPEEIEKADKLVLPGVGAFDYGMQMIHEFSLLPVLNKEVLEKKKPVLGICLGMQLLTKGSEEGQLPGLGWIDAYTYKFVFANKELKVPHIGWEYITPVKQHSLVDNLPSPSKYYFVHSYYVKCKDKADELLTCNYGIDFTCSVQHDNIMGVQFHPEKSHKYGMQLFKNFINL